MEITDILKQCYVEGQVIKLPAYQLDRDDYMQVKKKLELIGGKWKGGKVQGFEFKEDPTELLEEISNGENRNLKKEFQFFGTPERLAKKMVGMADIKPGQQILEPSAGQGAIVKAIFDITASKQIFTYELMPLNRKILCDKYGFHRYLGDDFMEHDNSVQFDRIIANPPFTKNQDIAHIEKMFACLKPGGRIVTLASCSWTYGTQKKQVAFKNWLEEMEAYTEEVPAGTFKESGTDIKTMLIVLDKPAEKSPEPVVTFSRKRIKSRGDVQLTLTL